MDEVDPPRGAFAEPVLNKQPDAINPRLGDAEDFRLQLPTQCSSASG